MANNAMLVYMYKYYCTTQVSLAWTAANAARHQVGVGRGGEAGAAVCAAAGNVRASEMRQSRAASWRLVAAGDGSASLQSAK